MRLKRFVFPALAVVFFGLYCRGCYREYDGSGKHLAGSLVMSGADNISGCSVFKNDTDVAMNKKLVHFLFDPFKRSTGGFIMGTNSFGTGIMMTLQLADDHSTHSVKLDYEDNQHALTICFCDGILEDYSYLSTVLTDPYEIKTVGDYFSNFYAGQKK